MSEPASGSPPGAQPPKPPSDELSEAQKAAKIAAAKAAAAERKSTDAQLNAARANMATQIIPVNEQGGTGSPPSSANLATQIIPLHEQGGAPDAKKSAVERANMMTQIIPVAEQEATARKSEKVPAVKPDAAAAAPAPAAAPAAATPAPAAAAAADDKAAKIAVAKAAAAEKAKAAAAAKAAAGPAAAASTASAAADAAPAATGPQRPPIPPGTPEAKAASDAAHKAAQGETGIGALGTPANKPAMQHLAAAAPKPAAAKAKAQEGVLPPPPQLLERRTFVEWSLMAWGVFFLWLAGIGHLFLRFMFPNVLYESDPKFIAGKRTDFPELNKVYENYKQSQAVWLVRLSEEGQDRLVALSTVCTHLGCTPNWLEAEQKFKCPCHGSGYYLNGVNFEGPTPRPLERFRVFYDATGNIVVDKAKKYRQDLQQWNETESFVTMS